MFYLTPAPRGFVGRPLVALLFAVGTGVLGYYIRSWAWAHLVLSLTIAGAVVLVGYLGYLDLKHRSKAIH